MAEEAFLAKGLSSTTALAPTSSGPHIRWDSSPEDLGPWCARLSERALALQEKAEECIALLDAVDAALRDVRTCAYEASAFAGAVQGLQAAVDAMAVAGYAHLERYVQALEARLRALLRARLLGFLEAWSAAFAGEGKEKEKEPVAKKKRATNATTTTATTRLRTRVPPSPLGRPEEGEGGKVEVMLWRCVHGIVLRDQALFLSPPLEAAEAAWVAQLHGWAWVGVLNGRGWVGGWALTERFIRGLLHQPTPSPPSVSSVHQTHTNKQLPRRRLPPTPAAQLPLRLPPPRPPALLLLVLPVPGT